MITMKLTDGTTLKLIECNCYSDRFFYVHYNVKGEMLRKERTSMTIEEISKHVHERILS